MAQHIMDGIEIKPDDFARRFSLRAQNLMWLLGAGASSSAGIPTAADMILDFKRILYVSQRRQGEAALRNLAVPSVISLLQAHIDALGNLPKAGSPNEYGALFEAAFPSEIDRRTYIDTKVTGGKPSYGHIALASLMKAGLARIVWTTNFDPMIEDACAKVYGSTGALTLVTLNTSELAAQQISSSRWPIEIKLHGDYRSRQLKNTDDELRQQDSTLRQCLVDCAGRYGLVVSGYSGRDSSVMQALHDALKSPGAFPMGLFWLHQASSEASPTVIDFVSQAASSGVEAAIVRIDNFDETMRDLVRVLPAADSATLEAFSATRQVWSAAPTPSGATGWPVIRLNALAFDEIPTVCRRVTCKIGGERELQAAVQQYGGHVVAARSKQGVLAFGSDKDVKAMLGDFEVTDFDLYAIDQGRLRFESAERGLVRRALAEAFSRSYGMRVIPRRGKDLLYPLSTFDLKWDGLKKLVGGPITGRITGTKDVNWHEGISISLDWSNDKVWLIVDPVPIVVNANIEDARVAAEFIRERTVKRYNRMMNELFSFWSSLLCQDRPVFALGIGDGVDARFKVNAISGYSRRAGA